MDSIIQLVVDLDARDDGETAELEALADAADVNTRGWWEQEM